MKFLTVFTLLATSLFNSAQAADSQKEMKLVSKCLSTIAAGAAGVENVRVNQDQSVSFFKSTKGVKMASLNVDTIGGSYSYYTGRVSAVIEYDQNDAPIVLNIKYVRKSVYGDSGSTLTLEGPLKNKDC